MLNLSVLVVLFLSLISAALGAPLSSSTLTRICYSEYNECVVVQRSAVQSGNPIETIHVKDPAIVSKLRAQHVDLPVQWETWNSALDAELDRQKAPTQYRTQKEDIEDARREAQEAAGGARETAATCVDTMANCQSSKKGLRSKIGIILSMWHCGRASISCGQAAAAYQKWEEKDRALQQLQKYEKEQEEKLKAKEKEEQERKKKEEEEAAAKKKEEEEAEKNKEKKKQPSGGNGGSGEPKPVTGGGGGRDGHDAVTITEIGGPQPEGIVTIEDLPGSGSGSCRRGLIRRWIPYYCSRK